MKRALILAVLVLAACREEVPAVVGVGGGNPVRGRKLVESRYACTSCHSIPNSGGAAALAAPPLDHIAVRKLIAGKLPNNPPNMMRWLQNPEDAVPGASMPDLNITEKDARDITAFLYTLR